MTVVMVPGLGGPAPEHWQERLVAELGAVPTAGPGVDRGAVHLRTDRDPLDLDARMADLEAAVTAASGPVVLVAHSAGVVHTVQWATWGSVDRVRATLLVTPPALHQELPAAYPRRAELRHHGYLPIPLVPLPFPAGVVVSDDDPLGPVTAVEALAEAWGARSVHVGAVGHANPASGYGPWPRMSALLAELVGELAAGDGGELAAGDGGKLAAGDGGKLAAGDGGEHASGQAVDHGGAPAAPTTARAGAGDGTATDAVRQVVS